MEVGKMGLAELIAECAANDRGGWSKMWRMIEGIAVGPVQQLLRQHRLGPELADDVLQELYLYLQVESARRLRLFRGTTEPEFRAYIRVTATRFARKVVRRWRQARCRESEAVRQSSRADRPGSPTDSQIRLAIRELLPLLPPDDYRKFQNISEYPGPGADWPAAGGRSVPARTARRWRSELLQKYAELV
jgi:hypothetical protein